MAEKKYYRLIAAIDFGTTHSGYAYSFKHYYKTDPLKISISTNQDWVSVLTNHVSPKAPTCVLLSPIREFIAFGYEAEDLYWRLSRDENHYDYYFFRDFKMVLHETNLSKATLIKDDKGKEAPALHLFAHVIRYLKAHMLSDLDTKGIPVFNEDIHWVLSLPAILAVRAKQFLRMASAEAGIPSEQLTFYLDSYAASFYCQHIPSTKLIRCPVTRPFLSFSAETKFMVIDLGGKTVHISIYQKQSNGTYEELHRPTEGPWGGTKVNEAFFQMLIGIVGTNCFQKFKDDYKGDILDIHRELEIRKWTVKPEFNSKVRIKLPISLLETFEKEMGEDMREAIQKTRYASKMTCKRDKLKMDVDLFKDLFREPVNMLVEHIQQLMTKDNLSDVSTLLMVGGFSESPFMQDAIMKAFPDKRVIVPQEAGLAVLKGAVMLAHKPCAVLESNPPGLL